MKNAAVIVYESNTLPQFLAVFNTPAIDDRVAVTIDGEDYNIFIISYPIVSGEVFKKRRSKILAKLCEDNAIEYTVLKNAPTENDIPRSKKEKAAAYGSIHDEIEAMKVLGALIRLSQLSETNVMEKNIGFITEGINLYKLDMLSEEASSIMVWEGDKLGSKEKEAIYSEFLNKKGISIVFTKSIEKLIQCSEVLIVDTSIDLTPFAGKLKNKIVLGKNAVGGELLKVEKVLLWTDSIDDFHEENVFVELNDHILSIIRYFNSQCDIIDFIKKFPHIYLFNEENSAPMALDIGKLLIYNKQI